MKDSLTRGLDKEGQDEVRGAFAASLPFRRQLKKVLNEKIEVGRKETCDKKAYKDGAFGLKMADSMGYERAQREMISLLSEKE